MASKLLVINVFIIVLVLSVSGYNQMYSLETKYLDVPIHNVGPVTDARTFKIRYLINSKFYVKEGPIFVYLGHQADITVFAQNAGFLFDIAPLFNALIVFIEHRYYGQSLPFGNETFNTPDNLKYLTSEQALLDFVHVIHHLRTTFYETNDLSQHTASIIVFGGSYGGMLAAWLRMKYPHMVRGAIASSAAILNFPGQVSCDKFYDIVTQVFQDSGRDQCIKTIKLGWDVIVNLSKTKLGMDFISSSWKMCKRLRTSDDVEKLLDWLTNIYVNLAAYNYHYPTELMTALPAYPVKVFCEKLTTSYFNDTKGLIEHYSHALEIYTNYTGKTVCNNINSTMENPNELAWNYQTCTELITPKCSTESDMFITRQWDLDKFIADCYNKFGVKRSFEDFVYLYYGGKNLKYYSNIVFSTSMMDPWSAGGVSSNASGSIWALQINDAPQMVDLRSSDTADNFYIMNARKFYIQNIKQWLNVA